MRAHERVFVAAPLFHQWGYAHFTLGLLLVSTLVLRRRFDPEVALATIESERATCCPMVPVMCQRILDLPEEVRRRYDTGSLRTVPLSGSALPGDLATSFMDEFGDVVYNLYGSTEVAWAAIAGPDDLRRAPGTAGRPPRGTTLRILDDDGVEVRPGQTGRIFVGNDLLFEGYSGGGSKETIDGLMATGDVGHFDDDGRLFVDGRDDDMIVSGGENVFPQEVEDTLARHDAVREVAVIGVDDEKFGQRLKAFVVAAGEVSEDTLKGHVKNNLAGYKVPREIVFVEELPRSEQGKVLKRQLADSS
jgi:fatty-acyl-CoA synthase